MAGKDPNEPVLYDKTVRDPEILGRFLGRRVVEITQQDRDEFLDTRTAYICLHFEGGDTITFRIGDDGFDVHDFIGDVDDTTGT